MTRPGRFRFPWRSRADIAADVDDELRFHVEMRAAELISRGQSESDARREALREFGDLERTRRYCRDVDQGGARAARREEWVRQVGQDLRFGVRTLLAQPTFALVTIVTLALGIGATTAIFSVVDAVLVRQLPFPQPDRLVKIWGVNLNTGQRHASISPVDIDDWMAMRHRIASFGGYWYQEGASGIDLTGRGEPMRLDAAFVTEQFFVTLEAPAALGRVPRPDEMRRGGPDHVVVLSDGFWRRALGADPSVLGRTLTLDGGSYVVVGVMPASFIFPAAHHLDVWIPASTIPDQATPRLRAVRWMEAVARLSPGATLAQAEAEMDIITGRLARQYPENKKYVGATIVPLRDAIVGDVRTALLVLLAAVAFVLLIACANVANLLLARGTVRSRELALRAALGAGRGRIVRQLLTESLLLAAIGGAAGVGLAWLATRVVTRTAGDMLPRLDGAGLDARVLLFAGGVTLFTGLAFGLAPALRAAAPRLQNMLSDASRSATGARGQHARQALVVAEVALAVVLVAGAGLMARSFATLVHVDPGFQPGHVVDVNLTLNDIRHPYPKQLVDYYQTLLERVRALPGVVAAGAVKDLPFHGTGEQWSFSVPGQAVVDRSELPVATTMQVSAGYFATMGVPLLGGRDFTAADRDGAPFVIVVNRAMEQKYWPGQSAVGKSIRVWNGATETPIVGVVGNIRQHEIAEEAEPTLYIHQLQNPRIKINLVARVTGSPTAMLNAIRHTIWLVDKEQTITSMTTLDAVMGEAVAGPRALSLLLGAFAALGLLLGMIGLYGVLAYAVAQRGREMGIRIALGAQPSDVLQLVFVSAMTVTAAGLAIGIAGALALGRIVQAHLFAVSATDPLTFGGTIVLLLVVAGVASYVPARRATRVDPVMALRYD